MKKVISCFILISMLVLFCGCSQNGTESEIVATTGPVYQFADRICQGTDLTVTQLITEEVSCLHDYTLQTSQMRDAEAAQVLILSGAGLEAFMEDILSGADTVIDCSAGVDVMSYGEDHNHEHNHSHDHDHEHDPHIWLSPENAMIMSENICKGLSSRYPHLTETFENNLAVLISELETLQSYAEQTLSDLRSREMITFHDGFAYFAHSFGLEILESVEEESGSEASAKELIELIRLVNDHQVMAVFTEINGSVSAADVISRETGVPVYPLDMAMSGTDYFGSMYYNINLIKEALG